MIDGLKNPSCRTVGTKQTIKAIESGKVSVVYIAEDADSYIKDKIEKAAHTSSVEVKYIKTMKELGDECGIQVGAAAAAALK